MTQNINIGELARQASASAAMARSAMQETAAMRQQIAEVIRTNEALSLALKSVQLSKTFSGPPNIQYIENIPGIRRPFDMLVDINIGANITSVQQGTIPISQEGPFIAVSRFATFLSTFEVQRKDPETGAAATFQGRSYGRYRPIHSAWDLNDGMARSETFQATAFPGTGAPHVLSPSNGSPFRSMETDMRIKVENLGSNYPRSNQEVPSPFWTTQINSAFDLGALDFFERGEVIRISVLPLHANNAAFGNISGFGAPNANYPFLASGWDYVEGINDQNLTSASATDPITRLPNGILTIGFHGYRIIQPTGSGPY